MVIVIVEMDNSSLYWQTHRPRGQVDWLGLRLTVHLALSLHSSNEPGELSQWLAVMTAPWAYTSTRLLLLGRIADSQ